MKYPDFVVVVTCVTVMVLSLICSLSWYAINERKLMAQNISEAIAKNMDPMSVRCSYANNNDMLCVNFSAKK